MPTKSIPVEIRLLFLAGIFAGAAFFCIAPALAAQWSSANLTGPSWGTAFGETSRNAVIGGEILTGEARLAWRFTIPEGAVPTAQTIVTEGIVLTATDQPAIAAINLETGALLWKTPLDGPVLTGTPRFPIRTGLLAAGSAIAAVGVGFVSVYDAFTGEIIGGFKPGQGAIELCEISGEYIFLSVVIESGAAGSTETGCTIYAMNLVSSKVFKVLDTARPLFLLPAGRRLIWGNSEGVFAFGEHGAASLSLRCPETQYAFSGDDLFFFSMPPPGIKMDQTRNPPSTSGQTTELICLDTLGGHEKWSCRIFDSPVGPPVVAGSNLIVSTMGRRVYSIFRKTGTIHWIRQYPGSREAGPFASDHGSRICRLPLCDGIRVALRSGQTMLLFSLASGDTLTPVILPYAEPGPAEIETICLNGRFLAPLLMDGKWSLGCFEGDPKR